MNTGILNDPKFKPRSIINRIPYAFLVEVNGKARKSAIES